MTEITKQDRLIVLSGSSRWVNQFGWRPGDFALVQSSTVAEPIGSTITCRVLDILPKATSGLLSREHIETYFPDSRLFKEIQERSNTPESGCLYGAEVLLELLSGKEVLFFAGTETFRRILPQFHDCVGKNIILSTFEMRTLKFSWYGVQIWLSLDQKLKAYFNEDDDHECNCDECTR